MSKELPITDYIGHILSAVDHINRHIAGLVLHKFIISELMQDTVIRNLEVIGEEGYEHVSRWSTRPVVSRSQFAADHGPG